jgi:hypothetical protein
MTLLPFLFTVALYGQAAADTLYAVDLYGLRSVSEAAVRQAVGVRAGDPVPASLEPIRARVSAIAGVAEVDVSAVCCSENGRTAAACSVISRKASESAEWLTLKRSPLKWL